MIELVAAIGVVTNGVVAQVLAYLVARNTIRAHTVTTGATIP